MYAGITEPTKLLGKTIIFKYGKGNEEPTVRTVEVEVIGNANDRGEILITGRDHSRGYRHRSFWIDPRHVTIVDSVIVDALT